MAKKKSSKKNTKNSKNTRNAKPTKPPESIENSSPEFELSNPVSSFASVFRAVILSPRRFFVNFETDGSLREPAIFAFIVGVVGGILSLALAPILAAIFGSAANVSQGVSFGLSPIAALGFAVLSPAIVAAMGGVYFVSIRTFIGNVADFRQIFRIAAYAYAPMIFAPIPILGALAVAYSLMVVMGIAIFFMFRTTFMTALVTALTGFLPIALILIALRGLAA